MAIDINKLRELYNKNKTESSGGAQFLKMKDGEEVTVRILPRKDGEGFFTQSKTHAINDAGSFKYYHCRRTTGDKCPICDAYFDLWKKSNAWDDVHGITEKAERGKNDFAKAARPLNPRPAYYMNVMVRPTNEVKVLSAPPTLYEMIMAAIFHPDLGDITDLEAGYDFIIKRQKGDNGFTNYNGSSARLKPTPAGTPQQIAAAMDGLHDLDALVVKEDYETLNKVAMNVMAGFGTKVSETPTTDGATTVTDENYLDRLKS